MASEGEGVFDQRTWMPLCGAVFQKKSFEDEPDEIVLPHSYPPPSLRSVLYKPDVTAARAKEFAAKIRCSERIRPMYVMFFASRSPAQWNSFFAYLVRLHNWKLPRHHLNDKSDLYLLQDRATKLLDLVLPTDRYDAFMSAVHAVLT